MQPTALFVATFYPEFLTELYTKQPELRLLNYDGQLDRILRSNFSSVQACIDALRPLGCRADMVIVNADELQRRWAADHGITPTGNVHDQRRQILAEQIDALRPDVLHVFEWAPMGDAFLAELKPRVRLLVGQMASPLRPERTYAAYDLMVSSWPPIVEYFRRTGMAAEGLHHAFDVRVLEGLGGKESGVGGMGSRTREPVLASESAPGLERVGERSSARACEYAGPCHPTYDVTFVGGFAPSHPNRVPWLERLLAEVDVDIFGYGLERVPPGSPIHAHHRGPAWGWDMYRVLQQSRLTLNLHAVIDVRGQVNTQTAANMRLYEATGVGACLLTEAMPNLGDMFAPNREVVTYRDEAECVEKIRYFLSHEEERRAIADAGQARTLREHTYAVRMGELLEAWKRHIGKRGNVETRKRGNEEAARA